MTDGSPLPIQASRSASDVRPLRWRAGLILAIGVAAALVVFRAATHLIFDQLGFDSDQAIVGLMAKHLSEGRAFPLFFYGQTYMLGVEAWAAVPFFLVAGPTVESIRLSLLAWNILGAALLVGGFWRDAGLRPWVALVPVLFFAAAPPSTAAQLMFALGGNVEPFVYVPLLWLIRDRPLWFGALLGIGFRNREFTLYAVPALLTVQALTGTLNRRSIRHWLVAAVAFCAVWEGIEALKPFADLEGPGTRGQLLDGFTGSQVGNLLNRFNWRPGQLLDRIVRLGPMLVAWFSGATSIDSELPIRGHASLAWAAGAYLLVATARLGCVLLSRRGPGEPVANGYLAGVRARAARGGFGLYLGAIGAIATVAFMVGRPAIVGFARYALLGILLFVGLTGAWLALEPRALIRRTVIAATICWTAISVAEQASVLVRLRRQPPRDAVWAVADRLVARGVHLAEADYWRAYAIAFVSRERVRVASTDYVRIEEYQRLVSERGPEIAISDAPCSGGERVGRLYLCPP